MSSKLILDVKRAPLPNSRPKALEPGSSQTWNAAGPRPLPATTSYYPSISFHDDLPANGEDSAVGGLTFTVRSEDMELPRVWPQFVPNPAQGALIMTLSRTPASSTHSSPSSVIATMLREYSPAGSGPLVF